MLTRMLEESLKNPSIMENYLCLESLVRIQFVVIIVDEKLPFDNLIVIGIMFKSRNHLKRKSAFELIKMLCMSILYAGMILVNMLGMMRMTVTWRLVLITSRRKN